MTFEILFRLIVTVAFSREPFYLLENRSDLTKTKFCQTPDIHLLFAISANVYTADVGRTFSPRVTNRRPQWTRTSTFTAAFNRAGTSVTEFPFCQPAPASRSREVSRSTEPRLHNVSLSREKKLGGR